MTSHLVEGVLSTDDAHGHHDVESGRATRWTPCLQFQKSHPTSWFSLLRFPKGRLLLEGLLSYLTLRVRQDTANLQDGKGITQWVGSAV